MSSQDFLARVRESWTAVGRMPPPEPREVAARSVRPRVAVERPAAPWGTFPLSELAMLAGIVATVIGLAGGSGGWPILVAGIALCGVAGLELAFREHFAGYRSHTLLLAGMPTVAVHAALAVSIGGPPVADVLTLVVDLAVFALFFTAFRAAYRSRRAQAEARS
jgi:hypothetical protein